MKKKALLVLVVMMGMMMPVYAATADSESSLMAKPDKCSPWPSCKNGDGGDGGDGGDTGQSWSKADLNVQTPWWNDAVDAEKAHAAGVTGKNTVVIVLDTGLGSNYLDFFPQENILDQYSRSYTTSLDNTDWNQDTEGHGTSVTGTVIGYRLSTSSGDSYIEGVAPDAKIVMFRIIYWVGGFGPNAVTYDQMVNNWAQAIDDGVSLANNELAGSNVVISMSLGYEPSEASNSANSNLENSINNAVNNGVVVSTSAGNSGPSADTTGYPAEVSTAESVAAAGWNGYTAQYGLAGITGDIPEDDFSDLVIADFSSRGKVDVAGIGWNLVLPSSDGSYYYISGTSFSCPQISGIYALMFEAHGSISVSQLNSNLHGSAYSWSGMDANTWGAGFAQADGAIGL